MSDPACEEILRMEGITKIYPNGFVANRNVDFSLHAKEIHALMGENGAGKSTLMKILFGLEQPQRGKIFLHGREIQIDSPGFAMQNGICMVHQHFMLVPSFTVAENMILGLEPLRRGMLNMGKAVQLTEEISQKYNLHIDPRAKVKSLSVAQKQKVEILKALLRGAEILILDEPTAVLTPQETEELFAQLDILKENGHTLVFISHKLNEIKQVCDRVTVLRNGKFIDTVRERDVTKEEISKLMVGREVSLKVKKKKARTGAASLCVSNLSHRWNKKDLLKNLSFTVRTGEVLGVAGVEGNGQEELVNIITGMDKLQQGSVKVNTVDIGALSVRNIRDLSLGHIPGDRIEYGVAPGASIQDNLVVNRYYQRDYSNKFLLLKLQRISKECTELVSRYDIKCSSIKQNIKDLSGGNMQKVVIARELSAAPKLLVANQPSRGVDVGSAESIYQNIITIRDEGTAVLLISSDLNEVLQLSDRMIVLHNGQIVAHLEHPETYSDSEIGQYMLGIKIQSKDEIDRAVAL